MKLFYLTLFTLSTLLFILGSYVHVVSGVEGVWTDLLFGAGLLGNFLAFSCFLLYGSGKAVEVG